MQYPVCTLYLAVIAVAMAVSPLANYSMTYLQQNSSFYWTSNWMLVWKLIAQWLAKVEAGNRQPHFHLLEPVLPLELPIFEAR